MNLLDGLGKKTEHTIPSVKEALLLAKGKIVVNLDKSYPVLDKCFKLIEETNTKNQVILKGYVSYEEAKKDYGNTIDNILFMPQLKLPNKDASKFVNKYLENSKPIAFAFGIPQDTIKFIKNFDSIRKHGSSVWVNALWKKHNGGHNDEKAALNPSVYDWFVNNDINIIQADRPEILLNYLKERGLHK